MAFVDDLKRRMVRNIVAKDRANVNAVFIRDAILAAGSNDASRMVAAVRASDLSAIGNIIDKLVAVKLETDATAEVDTMLADDNLTLVELERAFDEP